MEPEELSSTLLQPLVTMMATLGELVDTLPTWEEEMTLVSVVCMHWGLKEFPKERRATLPCIDDIWRRHNVASDDDDDPPTSRSWALAASKSTLGTYWDRVTMAASKYKRSVCELVDIWAELPGKATELHNTCCGVVTWARELQDEAARDWTAQESMVELGQALGREEGAEVVAGYGAQVWREAMVAASQGRRATMERQRVEVNPELLERLVAACDEATAFPRELQRRVGDIEAALEVTNWASPDVPEALVAKVAKAERLWAANARLAKGYLVGAVDDIIDYYSTGAPMGPGACGVAERCQRATEDIPRLLQPPERPRSVPKISPVSPPQLQALVAMVATLGMVAAAATWPHWGKSPNLREDLRRFTWSLHVTLNLGGVTCLGHPGVTSLGHPGVTCLGHPGVPCLVVN